MLRSTCLAFMRRPVLAYGHDAAPLGTRWVAPRGASLEHPQVAEGKVVLCRIGWIELAQDAGDLLRRLPRENLAANEAEVSAELVDMRIDGDEKRARQNVPQSEIDAIS